MLRRRGIWTNRDFTRLWSAATVSAFGTHITHIALSFVAILSLRVSPLQIGLLSVAGTLPAFAVGLFAGAWVDRLRRRPIMIGADIFRAAMLLTVPVAAWLDALSFVHLLVVAAAMSVASTCFEVADRSMLPSVVGRNDLPEANRMLAAGTTVAETTGFGIAGWLVQVVSGPGALAVDAATFIWSAFILARIEGVEARPDWNGGGGSIRREIVEGIRFIVGHGILRPLGRTVFIMSLAQNAIGAVFLLYVTTELGFEPGVLGMIFATGGLFSLAGSLLGGRMTARFGVGPLLIASLLLTGVGQGLPALATGATLLGALWLLASQGADIGWTLYGITEVTLRQEITPEPWQGRMNGSFHVLATGGSLVGALLGGLLGNTLGLRPTLLLGALGIAAAALPLLLSPIRTMRVAPPSSASSSSSSSSSASSPSSS